MDWREENRIIQLERLLDRAAELLRVYTDGNATDAHTEEVTAFLAADELRVAQL